MDPVRHALFVAGVILFQMVFGLMPFDATTKRELIEMILHEPPCFIENSAVAFIEALLVKNAGERLKIADALRHPWLHSAVEAPSASLDPAT